MRILIHRRTPDPIHPVARVLLALFDLTQLLADAERRGEAKALAIQDATLLDNEQAARLIYGRDDRVGAFRALRYRYPEIDAISIGQHRLRRWRRKDLEALIAKKRKLDHHPGWRGETP